MSRSSWSADDVDRARPARAGRPRRARRRRAARRRRRASWPAASAGRGRPRAAARCEVASARSSARGPLVALAQPAVLQHQRRSAPRTPRAPAGRWRAAARPHSASTWSSSTRDPGVALVGCRGARVRRTRPAPTQPPGRCCEQRRRRPGRRSRAAGSTIASAVSWPVSTDRDSAPIVAASARARVASAARREARSTTVATADGDRDEDQQRHAGCVGSATVKRADRRGEEPVERAGTRRPRPAAPGSRPPTSATSDGGGEQEQHRPAAAGRCRRSALQQPA